MPGDPYLLLRLPAFIPPADGAQPSGDSNLTAEQPITNAVASLTDTLGKYLPGRLHQASLYTAMIRSAVKSGG